MAHKTLIGGTAYEIGGGKTLINGTGYSIDKGLALVGGTVYEVAMGGLVCIFDFGNFTTKTEMFVISNYVTTTDLGIDTIAEVDTLIVNGVEYPITVSPYDERSLILKIEGAVVNNPITAPTQDYPFYIYYNTSGNIAIRAYTIDTYTASLWKKQ